MADYEYVVSTGVIVPDTATIIDEVNAEWRQVFGQDFAVDPETNQGAIIAGDVELRDATLRNNAAVANQINPDYSGGIFLDALWALTRGSRRAGTPSTLIGVVLGGQSGTIVPAGSLAAVSESGAIFATVSTVTIGEVSPGVVSVDMQSRDLGPVSAAPGALTTVATSVLGWETVTNPTAAIPGQLKESDTAGRRRRRQTLARQSVALAEAVISRLYTLVDVKSLQFRENYSDVAMTIDGIFMKKHSIWVCIDGGGDLEIATTLLTTKTFGAAYNGSVSVTVVEPNSNQTYVIQWDRPSKVILFARVTARFNNTDGATIIPNAVMAYANGELEGDAGLVVGASVSPFEISGAVNQVEPRIFVTKVELSTDGVTWSSDDLVLGLNQQAVLTLSRVLVSAV